MSRIDEMIQQLCPDGVEYKKLGEIGAFTRGSGIQKKDFVEDGKPCIHYGQVYTYYGLSATVTKSFISEELYAGRKKANKGNLVIATTSENEEDVCKCVAWLGDEPCAVSGDAYIFSHDQNPKYVAYLFCSKQFQEQKKRYITGTKVLRVSGDSMAKIELPFPPLEIQREIVRVLDSFAELEAELEARKAQYAFYRDKLLAFDNIEMQRERDLQWIMLDRIASFRYGCTATACDTGRYRFIRISDITAMGMLSENEVKFVSGRDAQNYLLDKESLLVARTGATFGRTLYFDSNEPAAYASFLIKVSIDKSVMIPRFYWHFAQSHWCWKQARRLVGNGGQQQFNSNALKK